MGATCYKWHRRLRKLKQLSCHQQWYQQKELHCKVISDAYYRSCRYADDIVRLQCHNILSNIKVPKKS